jgi:poly(ADP-ribose) glycohydrolase ARH3
VSSQRAPDVPHQLDAALRGRIHGAIVGTVVGDAFGASFEGVSPNAATILVERRLQTPGPWGYTDDALMFIAVAESIRDTGTIVPADLLRAFSRHYEPARGFGRGMKLAIRAFESGVRWEDVARTAWPEGSRGNGGAVRVGAVALRRWATTQDLLAAAELATRVTHAHAEAVESALVQVRFVALALRQPETLAEPLLAIDCVESDVPTPPS